MAYNLYTPNKKVVTVSAARPLHDNDEAVSAEIRIEQQSRHAIAFGADAADVVDALFYTLPGGTLDRVLIKMLERRASALVVPMSQLTNEREANDGNHHDT